MATKSTKNSSKSLTRVTKIFARKFVPTLLPPQPLPPLPSQNLETINVSVTLPVELWEAILDYVLTSPFLLEAECSPDDFYFFAVAHRAWDATSAERESRKNIRAVCRLWKAIVDRHARTWVHLESSAPVWTIPPETRRLDVFLSPAFHTSETSAALPVEPQVEKIAFRNIQVISLSESREREAHLTEAFVAGAYITPQSTLDEFNKVLKVFGWAETSVHSFIYEGRALGAPISEAPRLRRPEYKRCPLELRCFPFGANHKSAPVPAALMSILDLPYAIFLG
ncbi:hypothetical protein FRC17_010545 [Serendipita sp. 399]|nr:hypothetical protein FRC17_010545 [Serendipita sp. 399]